MSSSKRPSPPRRVEERDWRSRDDGEEYGYARDKEADRAWRDRRDSSSRQRHESHRSEDRRSRPSGSASASTSARPPAITKRRSRSRSPHEGTAADGRHPTSRASDAREGDRRGHEPHRRHDYDSYRHGRARSRSRSRSPERHRRYRRSDDTDSSDSDDDIDNHSYPHSKGKTRERSKERRRRHRDDTDSEDSGSDVEDRRHRREKRRKEDKEERRRRRERKREKKDRAHKKATAASTASWGKHGIITDHESAVSSFVSMSELINSMHKKLGEFRVWLVEERRLNPDTIGKDKEKREFATFVEDFNTATLPHEKYYDMAKYEIRMNLIKTGQTLPLGADGYDPLADEKAHENVIKARYGPRESELSREEVLELRRIQKERAEIGRMRILGMSVPKEMGVRTKEVDRDVLFPPDYYG